MKQGEAPKGDIDLSFTMAQKTNYAARWGPNSGRESFDAEIKQWKLEILENAKTKGISDKEQENLVSIFDEAVGVGRTVFDEPDGLANTCSIGFRSQLAYVDALALVREAVATLAFWDEVVKPQLEQKIKELGLSEMDSVFVEKIYQLARQGPEPPEYPYQPLDKNIKEMRVLILLPNADSTAEIQCRLERRCMKEKQSYAALSYVWGEANGKDSPHIQLNEVPFLVTPNLYSALKNLRHPTRTHVLWVDALCINQRDINERNYQVAEMKTIYKMAKCVFMWLGEQTDESELAMKWLLSGELCSLEMESSLRNNGTVGDLSKFRDVPCRERYSRGLEDLLRRPYWTRVWIVQEVVLASAPLLCCGTYGASWDSLAHVIKSQELIYTMSQKEHEMVGQDFPEPWRSEWLKTSASLLKSVEKGALSLAEYWRKTMNGAPISFLEGLVIGRQRCATNSRDHIYGVLGFVDSRPIRPEYGEPVISIYRDLVRHEIVNSQSLDILTACKSFDPDNHPFYDYFDPKGQNPAPGLLEQRSITDVTTNHVLRRLESIKADKNGRCQQLILAATSVGLSALPSWVPRWDLQVPALEQYILLLNKHRKNQFRAAGDTVAKFEFLPNNQQLRLDGLLFDHISFMSEHPSAVPHSRFEFASENKKEWERWRKQFLERKKNPYGGLEDQRDAFYKCTILGKNNITMDWEIKRDNLFYKYIFYHLMGWDPKSSPKTHSSISSSHILPYLGELLFAPSFHRFFITEQGYIGRGPKCIKEGDAVCIFLGGKVPFILRGKGRHYYLLGEACK